MRRSWWLAVGAAAAVALAAGCGGGGAHLTGTGGAGGLGGLGGAAGAGAGGGASGSFPATGRWWGRMMDTAGNLSQPVVLHWDAAGSGDRAWWTAFAKETVTAAQRPEGWEITVASNACYRLVESTSTPGQIDVVSCPTVDVIQYGYLRRSSARLVEEIAIPASGPLPAWQVVSEGFSNDGRDVAFNVAGEGWLWRNSAARTFDIGSLNPLLPNSSAVPPFRAVAFSADGRRVAYAHANNQSPTMLNEIVVYDTTTAQAQTVTATAYTGVPMFAPDGGRLVYYTNYPHGSGNFADLAAFDFALAGPSTLATDLLPYDLSKILWFTASGRHLLHAAQPLLSSTADLPYASVDFSSGQATTYGNGNEGIAAPDGSLVAFWTDTGNVMLLDDTQGAARTIGSTAGGGGVTLPALAPSPDSKTLAFIDGNRDLQLYAVASGKSTRAGQAVSCLGLSSDKEIAAVFTADASAIIYAAGGSCAVGATNSETSFSELHRHRLADGQEQVLSAASSAAQLVAVGPLGTVLYEPYSGGGLMLYAWSGTSVSLPGSAAQLAFTSDERTLVYSGPGGLHARDGQSGAIVDLGAPAGGQTTPFLFNEANGVTLALAQYTADSFAPYAWIGHLTRYLPTGESTALLDYHGTVFITPSHQTVAYTAIDGASRGIYELALDPAATPELIENGDVMDLSDQALVFRAPDGVCVLER